MDADFFVVTMARGLPAADFTEGRVRYRLISTPRRLHYWTYSWAGFREACAVVKEWKPDLIHVHGTEHFLGLVPSHAGSAAPVVVSLQGLLGACLPYVWGDLPSGVVYRNERLRDWLRMTGLVGVRRAWHQGATVEAKVLRVNRHFLGRTDWDRAQLAAANPQAGYHHVGELLRPEFWAPRWHLATMRRHTIFFGNLAGPHKGGITLLRGLVRLIVRFPDVRLQIAGSAMASHGYGRLFLAEAARLGIRDRIGFLGYLDAPHMADELAYTHVFVSPSFIDNSPNNLCEATLVGTPFVASAVGGVPSMVKTGCFFPAGDAAALADRIAAVFGDDALASRLSSEARIEAVRRHDRSAVMQQLVNAYSTACGDRA